MPRAIRSHHIWTGQIRGKKIVTSWHDYPAAILGWTERPLLNWFAQNVRTGETWLDIGAHYGYTAIALSQFVGPTGRVFAFEPLVGTAGYLTRTRQINSLAQLTVMPIGLAAPESLDLVSLPTTRGMADRTLLTEAWSERGGAWREALLVARLDWLWPRICGTSSRIDGIKVDVQGMEIEVLRGMATTLREHRPRLVVELHAGVDRAAFLDLLETLGYSRQASFVEPAAGETEPAYLNDRSYAFSPNGPIT